MRGDTMNILKLLLETADFLIPDPANNLPMPLFAGLPYYVDVLNVGNWKLVRYLLLLVLMNCAGGLPAARRILRPNVFVLHRTGWRSWFQQILCRSLGIVFSACLPLLAIDLLRYQEAKTLYAWLLFTLHMEMTAAVQALLMALYDNAVASVSAVTAVQLISLFSSNPIPGAWALLLPGNWGALARTAEFENPGAYGIFHGGFPLWAAFALNAAVLLAICLFGWRPVRRKRMKQ